MQTSLSTKGQVVVPGPIRKKLGLYPGDALAVEIENGRVVLTPIRPRKYKVTLEADPDTGLPVLVAEPGAPELTSEQVAEMLADFP